MWSRYGGLKQIDEFGPQGESLLEYAVYDALRAWFDHIVFVIREEFEEAFVSKFSSLISSSPKVSMVFQTIQEWREKPWWTLHATLAASDVVTWPFAVINADDWYGNQSYKLIADRLRTIQPDQSLLVWYVLWNTLSDHGAVNRGVCEVQDGYLIDVKETYKISKNDWNITDENWKEFLWSEIVSMNFRGFHNKFLEQANGILQDFIEENHWHPTVELPIPPAVDMLIHDNKLTCEVIKSPDSRQWVTNPEDKPRVQKAFDKMIKEGVYPEGLWEG